VLGVAVSTDREGCVGGTSHSGIRPAEQPVPYCAAFPDTCHQAAAIHVCCNGRPLAD